jgi:seryl-tRNA synthetase
MHDIGLIRDDPDAFDAALARRGQPARAAELIALDDRRRTTTTALQAAQTRRNEASKAIGKAKAQRDEATAQALMAEVATLKQDLPRLEAEEWEAAVTVGEAVAAIPNLPDADVPAGGAISV